MGTWKGFRYGCKLTLRTISWREITLGRENRYLWRPQQRALASYSPGSPRGWWLCKGWRPSGPGRPLPAGCRALWGSEPPLPYWPPAPEWQSAQWPGPLRSSWVWGHPSQPRSRLSLPAGGAPLKKDREEFVSPANQTWGRNVPQPSSREDRKGQKVFLCLCVCGNSWLQGIFSLNCGNWPQLS